MTNKAGVFGQTFDDVISGEQFDLEQTMLVFSVGSKDDLNKRALAAAVLAWRALKIQTNTAIIMHFGGYDEDPRELWEIPEVRRFVQKFCEKTHAHEHPQVEPGSRNWLLACGADPLRPIIVNPITKDQAYEETKEFFDHVLKPEDK